LPAMKRRTGRRQRCIPGIHWAASYRRGPVEHLGLPWRPVDSNRLARSRWLQPLAMQRMLCPSQPVKT
jgi:hypothetical protein